MAPQVGGMYAALMGKQKKSGNANSAPAKPKASKTISLKDTKDTPKKAPAAKKEEKVVAPKQEKVEEKDRDLTKREVKDERKATDRHVPRSGHPDAKGKKTDTFQDEVAAQKDAGAVAADDRRKERDEENAARRAREEELAKKITYTEYEKQLAEKKADLGIKKLEARKVDNKVFAKMSSLKKEEETEGMDFGLKKADTKKEVVKTNAKDNKKKQETVKAAPKKNKFVKSSDIQLGFTAPKPQQTRREFRPRPQQEAKPAAAAEPVAEAEKPAAEATEAAPVADSTE